MDQDKRATLAAVAAVGLAAATPSAAAAAPTQVGLSRRQLEQEMKWLLRRVPGDKAMAKALSDAFITLITKNNQALAASLGRSRRGRRDEGF